MWSPAVEIKITINDFQFSIAHTSHGCILSLTLGAHAQEGYCSCRVCLSVCLFIKSHLTFGVSVHPETTITYTAGNGGQKICGVFFETAPFKSYGVKRKRKSQYAN